MKDHIMDAGKAENLEDESRYRILSREELLAGVDKGDTVVDIGSGTGFFTDDLADRAKKVFAVDFQEEMHSYYREKGVPGNVEIIHSRAAKVELSEKVDIIVSILSLHEIALADSLRLFDDILRTGGKVLVVDWSANAENDDIPPREKLYTCKEASEKISSYFEVTEAEERVDTFKIKALKS